MVTKTSGKVRAFTLVELLVVIAIIGILVALLLPAIQAAREASRRTQCKNQLKNIGLACLNHVDTIKMFPTGGGGWSPLIEDYVENDRAVGPVKQGLGWGFQILPYLEENAVHDLTEQEQLGPTVVPLYVCPSRRGIVKLTFSDPDGVVRTYTLTDYASACPCTKEPPSGGVPSTVTADIRPSRINGTGGASYVRGLILQGFGADKEAADGSVFDGVIVRSPFVKDAFGAPGVLSGRYAKNAPFPTVMAKITDGTSKTMMITEKYIRYDLYDGGTASDDRGWTDGWDADTVRATCIQPLQDSDINPEHSPIPPNPNNPSWYTLPIGAAHTAGVNAVFADGSVHTITYDIDVFLLNALGTRNGTSAGPGTPPTSEVAVEGI